MAIRMGECDACLEYREVGKKDMVCSQCRAVRRANAPSSGPEQRDARDGRLALKALNKVVKSRCTLKGWG